MDTNKIDIAKITEEQAKAKENIIKKSASGTRSKYYDEEIKPKKSSGFAIFFMVMIVMRL